MRRSSVLLLVAATALFGLVPQALAATLQADSRVRAEIKLEAGDGLSARLSGDEHRLSLELHGHRQYVTYSVQGEVSESGIEARFGKLGEISVEFEPTRTTETIKPPPGCTGDPWITRAGFFAGTIHFRGERDYVEIDAGRAKGELGVNPDWRCARRPATVLPAFDHGFEKVGDEDEGDLATLIAQRPRDPRRFFAAYAVRDPEKGDYTVFIGGSRERREGMDVIRMAGGATRASTFAFDHERGIATVKASWPFTGGASFHRHAHGPASWRGTLRVPLLGAGTVALTGPGYIATLKRDFPSD